MGGGEGGLLGNITNNGVLGGGGCIVGESGKGGDGHGDVDGTKGGGGNEGSIIGAGGVAGGCDSVSGGCPGGKKCGFDDSGTLLVSDLVEK